MGKHSEVKLPSTQCFMSATLGVQVRKCRHVMKVGSEIKDEA